MFTELSTLINKEYDVKEWEKLSSFPFSLAARRTFFWPRFIHPVSVYYIILSRAFSAVNFARIVKTSYYFQKFISILDTFSQQFIYFYHIVCTEYCECCVYISIRFSSPFLLPFLWQAVSNVITQSQHQIAYFNFSFMFTIMFLWPLHYWLFAFHDSVMLPTSHLSRNT